MSNDGRKEPTFSSTAVKAGLKDSRLYASSVRTGRSFASAMPQHQSAISGAQGAASMRKQKYCMTYARRMTAPRISVRCSPRTARRCDKPIACARTTGILQNICRMIHVPTCPTKQGAGWTAHASCQLSIGAGSG